MKNSIKLYIVPHSHIDVEWYWTAEDTKDMIPQLFYQTTLPTLQDDPALRFAQDQAVLWQMMLQGASGAQRQLILDMVKEGKLEPVGGTYLQPEVQEPCGESFLRQIEIGQQWMQENLGIRARCAWHPDVFGQIDQLPQIFRQAGFDNFTFMRDINEADDPETFPTEFWLEGPDGSRILTHWMRISYVLCESSDPEHTLLVANITRPETQTQELQYVFRQLLDETSLQHKTGIAMLPWGGDVYGLRLRSDKIRSKLIQAAAMVGLDLRDEDIIFATPSEFFRALQEKQELLPVKRCDLTPPKYRQDLRGTYMSRVKLKQKNRKAEQALLGCESLCACAGADFSEGGDLWKDVLFGQFHDTIGGSCVDEVYAAAMERDDAAITAAEAKKQQLLGSKDGGTVLNLFNPTQFERSEYLTLPAKAPFSLKTADGQLLYSRFDPDEERITVHVPHIGPYETISLHREAGGQTPTLAAPSVIENEFYRLRFDPVSGNPASIFDKQAGRELLRGQGNVTVALAERDPDMEGALCLTGEEFTDENIAASSVTAWQTSQELCVKTCKEFLGFRLEKTVLLRQGEKAVEFRTDIRDYPGTDLIVTSSFPFAMDTPQSICQTPFSAVTGRKGFFCAQKWAGLQGGTFTAALLNLGACAYWTEENTLRFAMLRAHSNFAEYAKYGTDRGLARFADGKSHTELAAERGDHSFRYTLVSGDLSVAALDRQARCRNAPLDAAWSDTPAQIASPIRAVDGPFMITSLAACPEGGIRLRGYHACEKEGTCVIHMAKPVDSAVFTDLCGTLKGSASADGCIISMKLRPFEILTLHIR